MEVHAHAHTPRKKWTHYFWEFLMLFLAVFCGFLAEYQLEHKIEKERGKQYIISMYEDLKMDTAQLGKVLHARARRNEMFDSLFHLINSPENHLGELYFFSRHITRTAPTTFVSNERTIQQLKNSGGLRLIRDREISDSIVNYDSRVRFIQSWQNREEENVRECLPFCYRIFDGRVYEKMIIDDNTLVRPEGNLMLLNYSEQDMNSFLGYFQLVKAMNLSIGVFTNELYDKAVNLIILLKKRYHLK